MEAISKWNIKTYKFNENGGKLESSGELNWISVPGTDEMLFLFQKFRLLHFLYEVIFL